MERNFISHLRYNPIAQASDLVFRVVFSGDKQYRELYPNLSLITQPFNGIQNRGQMSKTQFRIKSLCKRFKINISSIHIPEEISSSFRLYITGGYRNIFYSSLTTFLSSIDNVLGENHWVIISISHTLTSQVHSRSRYDVRVGFIA